MGQVRSGERIDNKDRSFALTADAALLNRIAVIFGSTRNHVDVPDYRGQICAGLVDVIGTTATAETYASGDTDVCIARKGILAYRSGDTHAIGTKLSIYNTDGDLGTWLPGHHCCAIALETVSTAGDWGLAYFDANGSLGSHGGHYIIAGGAFAADGSFTTGAPAGFYKYSFVVEETNNQAVTGGLDIGTTSSGEELVSQQAISGLDLVEIAYDNTLTTAAAAIDLTANDSIYVSAHTNWTSAPSVTIWMILELLYE
jgi:hypothetical protein